MPTMPYQDFGRDTPSISIIRRKATTCLCEAVCRNDQPSLSKHSQPHLAKQVAAAGPPSIGLHPSQSYASPSPDATCLPNLGV